MATIETNKHTDHLCWSCYQPTGGKPFCPDCATILPVPPQSNYFSILGLDAKRMSLEPERLEEAFYALSRQVHPDHYQSRSPKERQIAEERAAVVNVAYRTLRDPIARTEYLLELETSSPQEHRDQPPAELLSQLIEIEEIVEAYRGSAGAERGALKDFLKEVHRSLEARREATETELHEAFELWDRLVAEEGSEEAKASLLKRLRELLHHRSYLTTTIRDLSAALAGEPRPGS
ncbi:Fe-S protein assembly co-chaperone HscB [Nitrospinae bacterium AH_259_B05_G02_I21]|nr:Fe-S protein assembly co-chaperone HscB [Nitrospinae bacterium AH_259_B05_G02_I21]